jgi:hypothetical protein
LSPRSRSRVAIIVRLEFNAYKDSVNKKKDFALFEAKHQYLAQSGLIGESLPNHKNRLLDRSGNRNSAVTPRPWSCASKHR